jgi:hypothetical protein
MLSFQSKILLKKGRQDFKLKIAITEVFTSGLGAIHGWSQFDEASKEPVERSALQAGGTEVRSEKFVVLFPERMSTPLSTEFEPDDELSFSDDDDWDDEEDDETEDEDDWDDDDDDSDDEDSDDDDWFDEEEEEVAADPADEKPAGNFPDEEPDEDEDNWEEDPLDEWVPGNKEESETQDFGDDDEDEDEEEWDEDEES